MQPAAVTAFYIIECHPCTMSCEQQTHHYLPKKANSRRVLYVFTFVLQEYVSEERKTQKQFRSRGSMQTRTRTYCQLSTPKSRHQSQHNSRATGMMPHVQIYCLFSVLYLKAWCLGASIAEDSVEKFSPANGSSPAADDWDGSHCLSEDQSRLEMLI